MTKQEEVKPFLEFLKDRFKTKIDSGEYYLSYSGGKDSHLLYWFIKEYLKDGKIKIVGVNTSFEIPEIRERIMRNSDIVLHPAMNRWDIKERFGIPCYSKQQDEYIYRYQSGNRSQNTMNAIWGKNVVFNLSHDARKRLLSGNLHKVSNKCCYYNKELPMLRYERESGRKPIIGVRQSESKTRKAKYKTCLQKSGSFTPIYDFSDFLIDAIYEAYRIPIPEVYTYLHRTGCAGCPYGRNCATELMLIPDSQRNQAVKYFRESYDVRGIEYKNLQMMLRLKK